MTEYCQCPRRKTRQAKKFRENGYYCPRCKKILGPNPHAPQYHQTSLNNIQSTHHQEESQQQPSQQEEPICAELEPKPEHITLTIRHTPDTRSHRRQLFSPIDTGANRTSSPLHTVNNWILQQSTPVHGQPQIISEQNRSNQNTPIQLTHTHISRQRTPIKPKKSVPEPAINNNTQTSRLSDIFTTPPRTPSNPQDLSQDIAVTSRKTSDIPRRKASSPIHDLDDTNISRNQVHFSEIRPSVIRNTISLSSDEETDGDQTDISANQTNANQNTLIPAQNAEESESESEAESVTF